MAKKVPNAKIVEVFKKKACNVSATCDALGINRNTFYRWRNGNKKLAEALDEAKESLIDNVESALIQKINEGELTGIIFFLKTIGRNRGYIERVEQEVNINPFLELMQSASQEDPEK